MVHCQTWFQQLPKVNQKVLQSNIIQDISSKPFPQDIVAVEYLATTTNYQTGLTNARFGTFKKRKCCSFECPKPKHT